MTVNNPSSSQAFGPRSVSSARVVAFEVLLQSVASEEGVDVLLDKRLRQGSLGERDRALAMELTYGVLRRLGTLDWRLGPVLDKPLSRLPQAIQMVLRLGAYQLMFLDRIPESAAVHESVELAKTLAHGLGRDWSGLVNAVLRASAREPLPPWPALESSPAKALAVRHSVPEWLSQRWIDRLGYEQAVVACEQTSRTPPVTLRVNRRKVTRDLFLSRLVQAGLAAKPTTWSPVGITLDSGGLIPSLPGFEEGWFYIEDEAAQLIPLLLDAQAHERILDACAAPGGKSTHLAEIMDDQGVVIAIDRKAARLEVLRQNCRRLDLHSVVPIQADMVDASDWLPKLKRADRDGRNRPFDRMLVDAPCSGLGVLRRHPEAKWRKDSSAFARHHHLQLRLLGSAAPRLRPGGVLVYSTCSTEPEETTSVIEEFLNTHAEFRRESVAPWVPPSAHSCVTAKGEFSTLGNQVSMDGFYAARLRKQDS